MNNKIKVLKENYWPSKLLEIPQPPKKLFIRGKMPPQHHFILCVVGSRKYSSYGKQVCEELILGLKNYPITIVSGLAYGIDTLAHQSALNAGLKTIAVPGSGLGDNTLYPRTNLTLAKSIINSGGCLISEFEPEFKATPWGFPQRNRIMAGISDAILVIEAERKSGTLITSRLATEYNRDVLAVPGSIFSQNSTGPHMLIKLGATPITCAEDILEVFGLENKITKNTPPEQLMNLNDNEIRVLKILEQPVPKEDLFKKLNLTISEVNQLLSILEIKGLIKEEAGLVLKKQN